MHANPKTLPETSTVEVSETVMFDAPDPFDMREPGDLPIAAQHCDEEEWVRQSEMTLGGTP